jgi:hypothetical protein
MSCSVWDFKKAMEMLKERGLGFFSVFFSRPYFPVFSHDLAV